MFKYLFAFAAGIAITATISAQPLSKAVPFYKNGSQLAANGKFIEAIDAFKKAILADKKYDSAYLALSTVFLKINSTDSAIAVLQKAVRLQPGFMDARMSLGVIYRDVIRNSDEAIIHFKKAYQLDSTNKLMLYSLAWCYNDKHQYREAIRYGIKALKVDNNYKPAYNELGHAYNKLKAYPECIEQFKKNLALSVNDLPLLYCGFSYIELKQKDEALKIYEALKKVNPKMAEGLKKKIDLMP